MEKKLTHEIAFFNLLRNIIPAKFKYAEYNFSICDMEEKLEMDRTIIRGLIKNLESDKLIKVMYQTDEDITLSFEASYDNLLEVFTVEDIEELIKEMQTFIKRNYKHFIFEDEELEEKFKIFAKKARDKMKFEGFNADINPLIKEGIEEILGNRENNLSLKKKIYKVCTLAEEEDLKALEAILFCDVNFPKTENPFYVTLFLTKLINYMKTA